MSVLPKIEAEITPKKKFKNYEIGYLHIDPQGGEAILLNFWWVRKIYFSWHIYSLRLTE